MYKAVPTLFLKCGQEGCSRSFGSFSGLRKHLMEGKTQLSLSCHIAFSGKHFYDVIHVLVRDKAMGLQCKFNDIEMLYFFTINCKFCDLVLLCLFLFGS